MNGWVFDIAGERGGMTVWFRTATGETIAPASVEITTSCFGSDPSSGWMYLPAMLIYTLFAPEPATAIFIATHILLSAFAAYALACAFDGNTTAPAARRRATCAE